MSSVSRCWPAGPPWSRASSCPSPNGCARGPTLWRRAVAAHRCWLPRRRRSCSGWPASCWCQCCPRRRRQPDRGRDVRLGLGHGQRPRDSRHPPPSQLDLRVRYSDPVLDIACADSASLWRAQVFGFYGGLAWSSTADPLRRRCPVRRGPLVRRPDPPAPTAPYAMTPATARCGPPPSPSPSTATPVRPSSPTRTGRPCAVGPKLRNCTVISHPSATRTAVACARCVVVVVGGRRCRSIWSQPHHRRPARSRPCPLDRADGDRRGRRLLRAVVKRRRNLAAQQERDLPSTRARSEGRQHVDRFSFVDRVGFCEQFAAAETVLLRAAGIPARLATGLDRRTGKNGRRVFRQKDLHAWVEVFYPRRGVVAVRSGRPVPRWQPAAAAVGTATAGGDRQHGRARRSQCPVAGPAWPRCSCSPPSASRRAGARLPPRVDRAPPDRPTSLPPSARSGALPRLSCGKTSGSVRAGGVRASPWPSSRARLDTEPRGALAVVEAGGLRGESDCLIEAPPGSLDRLQLTPDGQ